MELNKQNVIKEYNSILNVILNSIQNNNEDKFKVVDLLLFKDYLSRLYIWRKEFNLVNNHLKSQDSHNILSHLKLDSFIMIMDKERKKSYRNYNNALIHFYICWTVLKPLIDEKHTYNFPSPYDSVIKIILRGGEIFLQGGLYEINGKTLLTSQINSGEEELFLPSLNDDFLNLIDNSFGDLYLPSKKEIDKIYQDWSSPAPASL